MFHSECTHTWYQIAGVDGRLLLISVEERLVSG